MSSGLSRRGLFSLFGRSLGAPAKAAVQSVSSPAAPAPPAADPQPKVAIIQGRFCLAYTSFCTVCSERCPVPGAMKVENGIPMVVAGACTGCGVCHEVCPAPRNAVLMLPRQRASRFAPPPAT
jgi:Na+-translocating ferredoxin:NAD+ oxidoreductase RNF subunit RnfB